MSKDTETGLKMLLAVRSWRHERTLQLLENLQKFYDGDAMRGSGSDPAWTISRLVTPGRIRCIHEGVAPGSMPRTDSARADDPTKEKGWNDTWKHRHGRPQLLWGRAGMGKTFFSRWAAADEIGESISKLKKLEIDGAEVRFPIWLSAARLVSLRGSTLAECLRAWVLERGKAGQGTGGDKHLQDIADRLYHDVRNGGQAWSVFIDSLDHLDEGRKTRFRDLLESGGAFNQELILTSRPDADFKDLFPRSFPDCDVLELLPFNRSEQMLYLRKYAGVLADSLGTTAEKILAGEQPGHTGLFRLKKSLCKDDSPLPEMASTPLLLRFLCDLADGGETFDGHSKVEVYKRVIDSLLDGRWRESERTSPIPRPRLQADTCLLCAMLFFQRPEAGDFSMQDWDTAWEAAEAVQKKRWSQNERDDLLREWIGLGLVENEDSANSQSGGKPRYVFRHKSLLEFLAASYLADPGLRGWEEKIKANLGFRRGEFHGCRPGWAQTLEFLASHLLAGKAAGNEPGAVAPGFQLPSGIGRRRTPRNALKSWAGKLISLGDDTIDRYGDDFCRPLLALQVRFAAVAVEPVDEETLRRLAREVVLSHIGAGASHPERILPPLHSLARAFYQDLARNRKMTDAAIERLELEKSTYGLGLLGQAGAPIIVAILDSHQAARDRVLRASRKRADDVPDLRLRYLIDLARTGDDPTVVEWAKKLRAESAVLHPGDQARARARAQDLVRPLLICGGEASFAFLQELLKDCHWDAQAFQAGLEGPNAEALAKCIFKGIGSEALVPGLVGINPPDYDESLRKIWNGETDMLEGTSTPVTDEIRGRVGRVLLLRRSPPSFDIIEKILNRDPATIRLLAGRELEDDAPEWADWQVRAIRAAADDARLPHLRDAVKEIAGRAENAFSDRAKAFQVRYAATLFLGKVTHGDDLPTLRSWVATKQPAGKDATREWLALKLKAIEAALRVSAPEAKTFVSSALTDLVRSGECWLPLGIEESPDGVLISEATEPGSGARGAFSHALRLVGNANQPYARNILSEAVQPMLSIQEAIGRAGRKLAGSPPPTAAGTVPHVPWRPRLQLDIRREVRLARASSEGKSDEPRWWQRGQDWLIGHDDRVNFDDERRRQMDLDGRVPFQATPQHERLWQAAKRLLRSVNYKNYRVPRSRVRRRVLTVVSISGCTLAMTGCWLAAAFHWNDFMTESSWEISSEPVWRLWSETFIGAFVLAAWRRGCQGMNRWNPEFRPLDRAVSSLLYLSLAWLLPAGILLASVSARMVPGSPGDRWYTLELWQSALPMLAILAIFDLDRFYCVTFARVIPAEEPPGLLWRERIWFRALACAVMTEFAIGLIGWLWQWDNRLQDWRAYLPDEYIFRWLIFYLPDAHILRWLSFPLVLMAWFFIIWLVAANDPGHKSAHLD